MYGSWGSSCFTGKNLTIGGYFDDVETIFEDGRTKVSIGEDFLGNGQSRELATTSTIVGIVKYLFFLVVR